MSVRRFVRRSRVIAGATAGKAMIRYELPEPAAVEVAIVDMNGRHVRTLEHGVKPAGTHRVDWDGRSEVGTAVLQGVYFCRIRAGSASAVRRIVRVD